MMDNPLSVRLFAEDIEFVTQYAKEKNEDRTKIIREFVHRVIQEIRVKKAIEECANGKKTIREGAALAKMSYREFLDALAQEHGIGGDEKLYEAMIKDTMDALG